jgi:hypothetical protein
MPAPSRSVPQLGLAAAAVMACDGAGVSAASALDFHIKG